ncbi:hypothetical protein ACZ90_30210 [Streptomyces albus subsp. albus]|nr:hypothetical protein ACZ90_30210 [Streptomyces albus subsp. albus]
MSWLPRPGAGPDPAPSSPSTPEELQARVGKRLDDVAKILAGALVAVAGVMTALGLTSDVVFVALNNDAWPIYVATLCAVLAIVCSIMALLMRPTRRGNVWETIVLVLGVVFYMVALSVAVVGAAKAAGGNGRPNITDLHIGGSGHDLRLAFEVRADGVDTWRTIDVFIDGVNTDGDPVTEDDIYETTLRPNDRGEVRQRINVPVRVPVRAWGVQISAFVSGGSQDCTARSSHGPTCATLKLP